MKPIWISQNEYFRHNKGFAGITCFWTQGITVNLLWGPFWPKFCPFAQIQAIWPIQAIPCVQKQVIPAKPLLRLKYLFWEIQIGFAWKYITYHKLMQNFILSWPKKSFAYQFWCIYWQMKWISFFFKSIYILYYFF